MRVVVFFCFLFLLITNLSAEIFSNFQNPKNCKGCHKEQFEDWQTTWHSHAHDEKNELFREIIDYIQQKEYRPRANILLHCAQCHNPRIEVKNADLSYLYAKAFEIKTDEVRNVDKALKNKVTQNGIACFVCHNVDAIKEQKNQKNMGYNRIVWTKGNIIVGPFSHSDRTNFHKGEKRNHFIEGDDLCLICHQGNGNINNNLPGYEFGDEVASSQTKQRCVECHMPSSGNEIIAPFSKKAGVKAIKRNVRSHLFAGIRNSKDIVNESIDLSAKKESGKLILELKSIVPHKVPSGFSGRSIVITVAFDNEISVEADNLRVIYLDKKNKETISYIAKKLKEDNRLKPNEVRFIQVNIPKNAKNAVITADYYILSPQLQEVIKVKDSTFTKKYNLKTINIKL